MEVAMASSPVKPMARSSSFTSDAHLNPPRSAGFGRTQSMVFPQANGGLNRQNSFSRQNSFTRQNSFGRQNSMKRTDSGVGFSIDPSKMTPIVAVQKSLEKRPARKNKSVEGERLFVGLPLDVVSKTNSLNHSQAVTAGLKALKLMGVDGVELPVWWGLVEKDGGDYNWSSYLDLVELIHNMGLKVHVSFQFNACEEADIPLPEFVSKIGESNPDVFFTDRDGRQYKDCLSLSVDDLQVLDGRSPVQAYEDLCESFKLTFASYMDSTITGVAMGLGPNGDLCYPSKQGATDPNGVGEFQCYDKYMLLNLKEHAESTGNALWGLSGPHDAPKYNDAPTVRNFFKDEGGSWESSYGDFFLSWYSDQLVAHGDRLLSMVSSVFSDTSVAVSGRVPLNHNLCATRAHPCELTAGFYNTANRNGYEGVAQMFARNSANLVLPGLDLADKNQPEGSGSAPETLVSQIKDACRKNSVDITGQNSVSGKVEGTEQIKKNLTEEDGVVGQFVYQRMGADFFSPKHFPMFTELVHGVVQPEMNSDGLPAGQLSLDFQSQPA